MNTPPMLPIYFRAPIHGNDPIFSLSRAKLYQLVNLGLIKSVCLTEGNQKRATRLFETASVAAYIATCAARNESGKPTTETQNGSVI